MNFRQNFSQKKKILSPFQQKTLAETVNCIPKGLRKGNPFQGPFAQLSLAHKSPHKTCQDINIESIHYFDLLL